MTSTAKKVERAKALPLRSTRPSASALRCRRKFLHYFPGGFRDETYLDWERGYKKKAHERWVRELGQQELRSLLRARAYSTVTKRAINIESRTNLLFSFEKMALRDAVRTATGARTFSDGIHDFLDD